MSADDSNEFERRGHVAVREMAADEAMRSATSRFHVCFDFS